MVAAVGLFVTACGDNGTGNDYNDVRITITGIPATHWDAANESPYLRGVMMAITDEDGETVATGFAEISGGTAVVALMDGEDAWNGRGLHLIELTFAYYGGDYFFTGGQDFDAFLPAEFDRHNDDLQEHLPEFNITRGRHTIDLNQFRHDSTLLYAYAQ